MRRTREHRDGAGWYRIANVVDGPAQILIYDEIGMWGVSASDFIRDLAAAGDGPVEVHINSGGGDVFDAYAIYNALVVRSGVTTVVDSLAASAASVIAMAGEQRLMARTSQLMIHDASAMVGGNASEMQQMVERLQTVSGQIAGIYADTAGGEPDYWRGLMRAETWFTPQEAMDAGLITGVLNTTREPVPAAAVSPGPGIRAAVTVAPNDTTTAGAPAPEGEEEAMPAEHDDALTIEGRRSRIGDIGARLQEIAGQYPAAVLPVDTQAEWDQLVAERRDHQSALTAVDARNAVLAEVHAANPNTFDRPRPQDGAAAPTRPQAPALHPSRDIYDLGAIRQQARSVEDLPALYRDNAMRAIEAARFPGSNREDAQTSVERLLATVTDDRQGLLARRILATGSPGYSRVFGRALASGNPGVLSGRDAQILALGEATDAGGGYAVPFQLDPTIVLTSDGATNPLRAISRVERIVGKEFDLVSSAGVTVTRVAEATPAPDGSPTLAQPKVRAERVQGFIPFSVELEGDWTALQGEMMRLLTDAKDIEEASSFTLGNGTAPAAGGIIGTLPSGQQIATATTNVLALTDLYGLKNALGPRFRSRGQWMANSAVYDVCRGFGSSIANIWAESLQVGLPSKFIGYPVNENSNMDSAIATTKKIALFGDFSQYLIVDQVGMNMELIPQLFQQATAGSGVGLPTGQRGYYAWWRNNAVIVNANAFRLLKVL